jgi:Recombination endonuclease VII
MHPRPYGVGYSQLSPEQKRAYHREATRRTYAKRKAAGLRTDGKVPHPRAPRDWNTSLQAAWFEQHLMNSVCWICESTDHLVIDRDGETGRPRGILCRRCTGMLGRWQERSDLFQRAADYLKPHLRYVLSAIILLASLCGAKDDAEWRCRLD